MKSRQAQCTVCQRGFEVRFSYQTRNERGTTVHVCSQRCQQQLLSNAGQGCACSTCNKQFQLEYPFQVRVDEGVREYYCSTRCREYRMAVGAPPRAKQTSDRSHRIAVFNHKGGTGKTTTSVNLAAAMAEAGRRVLLIDVDGQGNVGASLGIVGHKTLYHVLVEGARPKEVAIPVRNNLDVITSNELLAAAELHLGSRPNRDRVMRERLGAVSSGYDVVVLDCAPSLSLLNQNALVYADSVIVPVSCDYLSLVGVKQVLRTISNVRKHLSHAVELLGVLPTFYDVRNRISHEALTALKKHFGDRCYPPIRVNTKLREAPSVKKTIFEYAPHCNGALDYLRLVDRLSELWWSTSSTNTTNKVAVPVKAAS